MVVKSLYNKYFELTYEFMYLSLCCTFVISTTKFSMQSCVHVVLTGS